MLTLSKPTNVRKLSMVCLVGTNPFLKPKPQALTSGATVMSKAPLVSSDTISARVNTSLNMRPTTMSWLLLTFVISDCLLNIDKASSTFCSSARMSLLRSSPYW